jgi:hypothetical protein
MLFFFPLGTPATWRMLTLRPPVGSGGESPVTLAQLQAIADQYTGGRLRLRDPVWISDFRTGGLHDPAGTALARLGCRPDRAAHYLIRPDGHIGYRALGAGLAGLHHYLTRWLTPASAG